MIAHRFATDGYTVMLVGRTEATLKQTVQESLDGADMHPWVADVSDLAAITAVMNGVAERFGRLDVLVNNAGTSRAALPHLRAARGCIVNVGSVSGLRGDWARPLTT